MTIAEDIKTMNERVGALENIDDEKKTKKKKKSFEWKINIPLGVARKARKENVFAVAMLTADKEIRFTNGYYNDGLLRVEDKQYAYEPGTIFYYKKRKIPVVVLYEWRLTAVGGLTDGAKNSGVDFTNEGEDNKFAEKLGLTNYGQQTIIRSIQQAQIPEQKKKLGGASAIMWLLVGVGVIYMATQFFGGI